MRLDRDTGSGKRDRGSAAASQLAEQADEHRDDPSAEGASFGHVWLFDQLQAAQELKMTPELGGRPEGYPQVPDKLCRGSECVTLRDVGRDRDGRTSDLIDQSEMTSQGWLYRKEIGSFGEVLGGAPSIQGFKLSHDTRLSGPGSGSGTRNSRRGAFFCDTFPVSRLSCPVSNV